MHHTSTRTVIDTGAKDDVCGGGISLQLQQCLHLASFSRIEILALIFQNLKRSRDLCYLAAYYTSIILKP